MYHKELIKEYLKNEETNPDEWANWQCLYDGNWVNCCLEPAFNENLEYRRIKKHPHAELMMQYAQDAMTTDKPWELWQWNHPDCDSWNDFSANPNWTEDRNYRRKA